MNADDRTVIITGLSLIRVSLAVDIGTHFAFFVTRKHASVVTIASEAVLCSLTYTKSRHGCQQIGVGSGGFFSVGDLLLAFDLFT